MLLRISKFMSIVLIGALGAVGQTAPARRGAPAIPRMTGGKPNLNGTWQAMTTAYRDLRRIESMGYCYSRVDCNFP